MRWAQFAAHISPMETLEPVRALVTVETVTAITPIENADFIAIAKVRADTSATMSSTHPPKPWSRRTLMAPKVAKAAVSSAVLVGLLLTTACGNDSRAATAAPDSPSASQGGTAADKPLGIDPASVPVPADVTAAFGEKASANLVHDALAFQAAAESFHQLQVLPLKASAESIAADINLQLGQLTTPKTLADITKEANSPDGSPVIPGFTQDQAANGIAVDGKTYHAIGQGVSFSNGKPVVSLSKETTPVTQNEQTVQGPVATVAIDVNIAIPAKEGTVNAVSKCVYNLIPTPDGHWLVAGYRVDGSLTAHP